MAKYEHRDADDRWHAFSDADNQAIEEAYRMNKNKILLTMPQNARAARIRSAVRRQRAERAHAAASLHEDDSGERGERRDEDSEAHRVPTRKQLGGNDARFILRRRPGVVWVALEASDVRVAARRVAAAIFRVSPQEFLSALLPPGPAHARGPIMPQRGPVGTGR